MSPLPVGTSAPWKIEKRETCVPGRFALVTQGTWWVVVNPHGGVNSFDKTEANALAALDKAKREWFCQCGGELCHAS